MEHFLAILRKPAYSLPLAACLCSLLSCGGSGDDKVMTTPLSTASPTALALAAPPTDCDKYSIRYLHEIYDKADLDSLTKVFLDHFQVDVSGTTVMMKDTVLRIPWKSILIAQRSVAKAGKLVRGVYISYGLDGDKFHPIFEFMYPDPTNGNLEVFAGTTFSFDGQDLKPEADPKKFTDAYFKNIRVNRTGTGFSSLKNTGADPDPLATWYQYADKVNDLLEQNPVQDTVLVVSCISQQLCYGALASGPAPHLEFRHLLVLHVADGPVDQLTTGTFDPLDPYLEHAMDLGGVCPPNCPKGKP